jgi:protein SCO1/2/putative membrane protein
MSERWMWSLVGVVAACAVAVLVRGRAGDGVGRVPAFALMERSGKPLTLVDLRGEVWAAEFIFTRCAGTCPVMVSRMASLHRKHPGAKYVSFTVDPTYDTPAVLAAYARNNSLPAEWLFATGTLEQMQSLAKEGFKLSMGPGSDPKEPIIHSDRIALVDRYGRIRATVSTSDEGALDRLEGELGRLLAEKALPVRAMPALNAGLNGTAALCLLAGLALIKAKRPGAHRALMLTALGFSTLFLASYLTLHGLVGATPYRGQGGLRTLYFAILLSHTILAVLVVPLAGMTLWRAFQERFDRHRALARWTLPIWLYVSVTGVVIYFMLY